MIGKFWHHSYSKSALFWSSSQGLSLKHKLHPPTPRSLYLKSQSWPRRSCAFSLLP